MTATRVILFEQVQPFSADSEIELRETCRVAARPRQACDQAAIDRIASADKYDGDVARHTLQSANRSAADGQQQVGRLRNELRRVSTITLAIACAPAIVDLKIAAGLSTRAS